MRFQYNFAIRHIGEFGVRISQVQITNPPDLSVLKMVGDGKPVATQFYHLLSKCGAESTGSIYFQYH